MSTPYTTNLCPNGSFETGLEGWTALSSTAVEQVSADAVAGQYSMLVTTSGLAAGEGVTGPQVLLSSDANGSMIASFSGESGTIIVSAVGEWGNGGAVILGQQTIDLTPAWQQAELDNLDYTGQGTIYLLIQTVTAEALSFLVDAVQYEPESPAHSYIDGSFPGCSWEGAEFASASTQAVQNALFLTGGTITEGSIQLIITGEIFQMSPGVGEITSGGSLATVVVNPTAAFDDFAIYELDDPDPAMSYAGWNTARLLSGHSMYARPWGIFYPPLDYPVSDGSLLWPRAAFMAVVMEFTGNVPGVAQNLTGVQAEMMPIAGTEGMDQTPEPSVYDSPRAVHVIVKPTRLNYSPNPSFEESLDGWTAVGGGSISQDSSVQYGVLGSYDGTDFTAGQYSMAVNCSAAGDGVSLVLSDLIAGDTYTASVYALPQTADAILDIQLQAGGTVGGVDGADGVTPLPLTNFDGSDAWVRPSVTFTAPASTVTLTIRPLATAFPVVFNLDANLIETGEIVGSYFDGDEGSPDYLWEGTPGLSRSYYYENYAAGQVAVLDILARHTPVCITASEPSYLTPPTQ